MIHPTSMTGNQVSDLSITMPRWKTKHYGSLNTTHYSGSCIVTSSLYDNRFPYQKISSCSSHSSATQTSKRQVPSLASIISSTFALFVSLDQVPIQVLSNGLAYIRMNDVTNSLLTEHFSYTPLVRFRPPRSSCDGQL